MVNQLVFNDVGGWRDPSPDDKASRKFMKYVPWWA